MLAYGVPKDWHPQVLTTVGAWRASQTGRFLFAAMSDADSFWVPRTAPDFGGPDETESGAGFATSHATVRAQNTECVANRADLTSYLGQAGTRKANHRFRRSNVKP